MSAIFWFKTASSVQHIDIHTQAFEVSVANMFEDEISKAIKGRNIKSEKEKKEKDSALKA